VPEQFRINDVDAVRAQIRARRHRTGRESVGASTDGPSEFRQYSRADVLCLDRVEASAIQAHTYRLVHLLEARLVDDLWRRSNLQRVLKLVADHRDQLVPHRQRPRPRVGPGGNPRYHVPSPTGSTDELQRTSWSRTTALLHIKVDNDVGCIERIRELCERGGTISAMCQEMRREFISRANGAWFAARRTDVAS
jgi:hypothetical protein